MYDDWLTWVVKVLLIITLILVDVTIVAVWTLQYLNK